MPINSKEDFEYIDEDLAHHYPPHPGFSQSQKIAAAMLAFFSVVIVIFWFWQFKTDLLGSNTVVTGEEQPIEQNQMCANGQCDQNYDLKLRGQDTDGDKLSDWDELNVYLTSPYLEDSDSDGYTDSDEISRGQDPNCPLGRDCASVSDQFDTADDQNSINDLLVDQKTTEEEMSKLEENVMSNIPSADTTQENPFLNNSALLRTSLIEAGIDKELLDQFSDAELMETYKQTLDANTNTNETK